MSPDYFATKLLASKRKNHSGDYQAISHALKQHNHCLTSSVISNLLNHITEEAFIDAIFQQAANTNC